MSSHGLALLCANDPPGCLNVRSARVGPGDEDIDLQEETRYKIFRDFQEYTMQISDGLTDAVLGFMKVDALSAREKTLVLVNPVQDVPMKYRLRLLGLECELLFGSIVIRWVRHRSKLICQTPRGVDPPLLLAQFKFQSDRSKRALAWVDNFHRIQVPDLDRQGLEMAILVSLVTTLDIMDQQVSLTSSQIAQVPVPVVTNVANNPNEITLTYTTSTAEIVGAILETLNNVVYVAVHAHKSQISRLDGMAEKVRMEWYGSSSDVYIYLYKDENASRATLTVSTQRLPELDPYLFGDARAPSVSPSVLSSIVNRPPSTASFTSKLFGRNTDQVRSE